MIHLQQPFYEEDNMKDKEFLRWIYKRLELIYKENPHADYMYKLASIIRATPEDKITPNVMTISEFESIESESEVRVSGVPYKVPRGSITR